VRDDQLSLAIGRRGQNVRLAARLTGWDVDILTPPEFQRGLEILEETVRGVEGVTDEMLDRMGVLGLISVFDVEEVGEAILVNEAGMSDELAVAVVDACTERAKVVAAEQEAAKQAEAERMAAEGGDVVDGILGGGGTPATDQASEAAADDILGR
jgi:N utilization substance protein A